MAPRACASPIPMCCLRLHPSAPRCSPGGCDRSGIPRFAASGPDAEFAGAGLPPERSPSPAPSRAKVRTHASANAPGPLPAEPCRPPRLRRFLWLRWSNDMEPGVAHPKCFSNLHPKLEWWNCTLMRNAQPSSSRRSQHLTSATPRKRFVHSAERRSLSSSTRPHYPHVRSRFARAVSEDEPARLYGDVWKNWIGASARCSTRCARKVWPRHSVFFTSDNAVVGERARGVSRGALSGVKQHLEGGMREPGIALAGRSKPALSTARWLARGLVQHLPQPWPRSPSRRSHHDGVDMTPCCWKRPRQRSG